MTIQEAVEKCIWYSNGNNQLTFKVFELVGTSMKLEFSTSSMDDLVVHMFDMDVRDYDVVSLQRTVLAWTYNPADNTCMSEVNILVNRSIKG